MSLTKIGIIKEGKIPVDKRVPLTPQQAKLINDAYDNVEVVVQSSDIRCYTDQEYVKAGVKVVEDVNDCDVLMGVKEVPIASLLANKTYFFFSHTVKKQPYNRELLQTILAKQIRLIDYELLTSTDGARLVAFGRYAGIVGAYNGIWTYGKRYNLFDLRRAKDTFDLQDLTTEYSKVKLPYTRIVVTGGGRVAKGAIEVLNGMNIRQVSPGEYLNERFNEPVFTQLNSRNYNKQIDGNNFDRQEFFEHPERYTGDFIKYAQHTDLLIAAAYWAPNAPVLFKREDVLDESFAIKVVADITCDIEGSIPSTKQPSTIEEPIYDYNPSNDVVERPLKEEGNITVMAVDNLPCELPRDASTDFGTELVNNVLPSLLGNDAEGVIHRATVTNAGQLTEAFSYLDGFAKGLE